MMTMDSAFKSSNELAQLIEKDPLISQLPSIGLALHVLYERFRPKSFWTPYLNILTHTSYATPYYFTLNELQALKGSPVEQDAIRLLKNTARQYTYLYKIIKSLGSNVLTTSTFSYEMFIWAVSVVMTRQNLIPYSDNTSQLALIPGWDMCNHSDGEITTFYQNGEQSAQCQAMDNFKKGNQVYIFYGKRPNSELFLYSGFVFVENKYDSLKIKAEPIRDDPLIGERLKLLTKYMKSSFFIIMANSVPDELLAYYRILAMEASEMKDEAVLNKFQKEPLNQNNESRARQLLIQRLQQILASYNSTPEVSSSDGQNYHLEMCRLLKESEKQILQSCIEFLQSK